MLCGIRNGHKKSFTLVMSSLLSLSKCTKSMQKIASLYSLVHMYMVTSCIHCFFCAMLFFFVTIIISTFRFNAQEYRHPCNNRRRRSKGKSDDYIREAADHLERNQSETSNTHWLKDTKLSTNMNGLDPFDLHCIPVLFSAHPCELSGS